jgi:low affinity Fe/Cu permease
MFSHFARWVSRMMGRPSAFVIAILLCVAWIGVSPLLDKKLSWQDLLLVNVPSVITLLMVFLVQHTQNHHNDVVQVKLDELIRAMKGAHNAMVHLEELSPEELGRVKAKYQLLAERVKEAGTEHVIATGTPHVDPSPGPSEGAKG